MFRKAINEMKQAKEELEATSKEVDKLIKESKDLRKQNKELLSKIAIAEQRGGCLLLSDLNEDLIKKLQELTDDNVVVIFLEKSGDRIEIRQDSFVQKRTGVIR